jgi:hypothetical protein
MRHVVAGRSGALLAAYDVRAAGWTSDRVRV